MTSSRAKAFVPGKGYVNAPEPAGRDDHARFDGDRYVAEREAAQYAKIAASMDRALGRTPDLPGRKAIGFAGPSRCDSSYDPMGR